MLSIQGPCSFDWDGVTKMSECDNETKDFDFFQVNHFVKTHPIERVRFGSIAVFYIVEMSSSLDFLWRWNDCFHWNPFQGLLYRYTFQGHLGTKVGITVNMCPLFIPLSPSMYLPHIKEYYSNKSVIQSLDIGQYKYQCHYAWPFTWLSQDSCDLASNGSQCSLFHSCLSCKLHSNMARHSLMAQTLICIHTLSGSTTTG